MGDNLPEDGQTAGVPPTPSERPVPPVTPPTEEPQPTPSQQAPPAINNGSTTIEQDRSAQTGRPEAVASRPSDRLNGYYYNKNTGRYVGKIANGSGNLEDVYACTGASGNNFISPQRLMRNNVDTPVTHREFQICAQIVQHESGTAGIECVYIAFTAANNARIYASRINKYLYNLLMTGYSSMPQPAKVPLPDLPSNGRTENAKYGHARKGLIAVFLRENDPTGGATHWDGTDFIAWGLNNPAGVSHAKFRQYKKITISRSIYDQYLTGTLNRYTDARVTYSRRVYNIPAAVFVDRRHWQAGSFIYTTNARRADKDLTATVTAGHTIFWKAH